MSKPEVASRPTSVERTFRILQAVVAADGGVGVRELARRTGLARSTVSRLLGVLETLGMVERHPDGSVSAGTALATLQPRSTPHALVQDRLRPLLIELTQTFGEGAAVSIDDGDKLVYLAQVSSEHAVSVPDVEGGRNYFHHVAAGWLTMSYWSSERLASYLDDSLESATDFTITNAGEAIERINDLRSTEPRRRIAWANQELEIGVNGLAGPVLDDAGDLVATISLFGPTYRLSPEATPNLGAEFTELLVERSAAFAGGPLFGG